MVGQGWEIRDIGRKNYKDHEKTFGSDQFFKIFDCDDAFMDDYVCHNLLNCTLEVCAIYCMSITSKENC